MQLSPLGQILPNVANDTIQLSLAILHDMDRDLMWTSSVVSDDYTAQPTMSKKLSMSGQWS